LDNGSLGESKRANIEGESVGGGVNEDTSESSEGGLEADSKSPFLVSLILSIETANAGNADSHSTILDDCLGIGGVVSRAEEVARLVVTELLGETREDVIERVSVHGDGGVLGKQILSDVELKVTQDLEIIQEGLGNILTEEQLESTSAG